jgi:hypothetical protein
MPATEAEPSAIVIAGVIVSLCAQDRGGNPDKGGAHHDCDICSLRAPAALPSPPPTAVPSRVAVLASPKTRLRGIRSSLEGQEWHLPRGPPSA